MKTFPSLCAAATLVVAGAAPLPAQEKPDGRPNILWIIAEDMGPWLGCYGNQTVHTPNIDALAAKGVRFANVWSSGAACSPSRSSMFSGMYAFALGTETHREARPVPEWAFFAQYLRQGGYYCTNNKKTDYNAKPVSTVWWDESSGKALYTNRAAGQPFFHCYSSLMETHMSCIIDHPLETRGNRTIPIDAAVLPAWLPGETAIKDDRAWHLHSVGLMDQRVGHILDELKKNGEADNTIVFFFSDHGGCMPDGKGFAWEYGFRVPFIAYFPPKYAHLAPAGTKAGGTCETLVSFMDFGPTLFSFAGIKPPAYLQGQAFAGPQAASKPREWLLAFRGINGGRWDPVRTIRDERYLYTRNFLPHRPAGQRQDYQWMMPGQQAWEIAFQEGRCNSLQSRFWRPRPSDELYDLATDPEQTRNLASDPAQAGRLTAMRSLLRKQLAELGDIAFTPNSLRAPAQFHSFYDRMHASPEAIRDNAAAAWLASSAEVNRAAQLQPLLGSPNPVVRYWAGTGLARLAYTGEDLAAVHQAVLPLLQDPEAQVRVAAAEAVCALGDATAGIPVLLAAVRDNPTGAGREALAAIETLGPKRAAAAADELARLNAVKSTFFLRSALITLGRLPYTQLYLKGVREASEG